MFTGSDDLLTIKEVAVILKCSNRTVYNYIDAGLIPACKIGPYKNSPIFIKKIDLDNYILSIQQIINKKEIKNE